MTWESDQDQGIEIKDRSKYLWGVVAVLVLAMIAMVFVPKTTKSNQSAVYLKQILVTFNAGDAQDRARAYEIIETAHKQLVDGVAFKTVAKNYSNDPQSASRGGNVGWMDRGTLVAEIEKYAWDQPVGQLSGIIVTQYGFHVVLITQRVVSDTDAYEERLRRQVLEGDPQAETQP